MYFCWAHSAEFLTLTFVVVYRKIFLSRLFCPPVLVVPFYCPYLRRVLLTVYTVGQKHWSHRLMTIRLSNFNRFKKITGRCLGKCVVKWILKIPTNLAYVDTLFCETLMSAKQAINDKLKGSVATYWRCGRVVNNPIKKGLLLSLWVYFLNRWIFGKVTSNSVVV